MSSHKPRSRPKRSPTPSYVSPRPVRTAPSKPSFSDAEFPLAAFFWPARTGTSQWVTLPLTLMIVGLFRWAVGFWGYSGFQTPPMHGDYEAQRHWMEITTHLPISKWYFYDLHYWGLDYPPLTAYHSWVLGKVGSLMNPKWFALDASRGIEDSDLKIYMRATVLVSESLSYIPAIVIFNRRLAHLSGIGIWESSIALAAILMQPGTLLVDHGHFQYNTVMLGLAMGSFSSMLAGRRLWGCVFFVGSLCFKQMALYFAPAVFAYLLGVCVNPKVNPLRFIGIAVVTVLSYGVAFAPLLAGAAYEHYTNPKTQANLEQPALFSSLQSLLPFEFKQGSILYPIALQLTQAIHRIFPLARGLFEDKVANVWCALHTVYKLNKFSVDFLSRLSLLATLVAITPACFALFLSPRKSVLPYALASCAWGFFLFSFQVHEKSVLLPLLPMTVLLGGQGGISTEIRAWVGWANVLGTWTMFPLLKRDELRIPYAVVTLLWAYLLGLPPTSLSLYTNNSLSIFTKVTHLGVYVAMIVWHLAEAIVPTPANKPDLWVVLNCLIGVAGFGICYLWCTWNAIIKSSLIGPAGQTNRSAQVSSPAKLKQTLNGATGRETRAKSP